MTSSRLIQRVVIPLGTSRASVASLATWVDLARRLEAEIAGLFVEDPTLLHVAGYSFGQVIGSDSVARTVDSVTIARALRCVAADARAALEASAARHAITCSFSTVRGDVAHEIVANATPGDLVVVEAAAFAHATPPLERAQASVLYLNARVTSGRTVVVHATPADERLIAVAAGLAAATRRSLEIVLADGASDQDVRSVLARIPSLSSVRTHVHGGGVDRVRALLRQDPGAILVERADASTPPPSGERDAPTYSRLTLRGSGTLRSEQPQ